MGKYQIVVSVESFFSFFGTENSYFGNFFWSGYYAITNYEKHYLDNITADNSICLPIIHI